MKTNTIRWGFVLFTVMILAAWLAQPVSISPANAQGLKQGILSGLKAHYPRTASGNIASWVLPELTTSLKTYPVVSHRVSTFGLTSEIKQDLFPEMLSGACRGMTYPFTWSVMNGSGLPAGSYRIDHDSNGKTATFRLENSIDAAQYPIGFKATGANGVTCPATYEIGLTVLLPRNSLWPLRTGRFHSKPGPSSVGPNDWTNYSMSGSNGAFGEIPGEFNDVAADPQKRLDPGNFTPPLYVSKLRYVYHNSTNGDLLLSLSHDDGHTYQYFPIGNGTVVNPDDPVTFNRFYKVDGDGDSANYLGQYASLGLGPDSVVNPILDPDGAGPQSGPLESAMYISYYVFLNGGTNDGSLRLARQTGWAQSGSDVSSNALYSPTFAIEMVDDNGDIGLFSDLAVTGTSANPIVHIAYYKNGGGLWYARKKFGTGGYDWVKTQLDAAAGAGNVEGLSIAAYKRSATETRIGIAYGVVPGGGLKYIEKKEDGTAVLGPATVGSESGSVGEYVSLAFNNPFGRVHTDTGDELLNPTGKGGIAYYDYTNTLGDLKYAGFTNPAGNALVLDAGNPFIVDTGDNTHPTGWLDAWGVSSDHRDVGLYTSLTFDYLSTPQIAYYTAGSPELPLSALLFAEKHNPAEERYNKLILPPSAVANGWSGSQLDDSSNTPNLLEPYGRYTSLTPGPSGQLFVMAQRLAAVTNDVFQATTGGSPPASQPTSWNPADETQPGDSPPEIWRILPQDYILYTGATNTKNIVVEVYARDQDGDPLDIVDVDGFQNFGLQYQVDGGAWQDVTEYGGADGVPYYVQNGVDSDGYATWAAGSWRPIRSEPDCAPIADLVNKIILDYVPFTGHGGAQHATPAQCTLANQGAGDGITETLPAEPAINGGLPPAPQATPYFKVIEAKPANRSGFSRKNETLIWDNTVSQNVNPDYQVRGQLVFQISSNDLPAGNAWKKYKFRVVAMSESPKWRRYRAGKPVPTSTSDPEYFTLPCDSTDKDYPDCDGYRSIHYKYGSRGKRLPILWVESDHTTADNGSVPFRSAPVALPGSNVIDIGLTTDLLPNPTIVLTVKNDVTNTALSGDPISVPTKTNNKDTILKFDASASSSDPPGGVLHFVWDFGDTQIDPDRKEFYENYSIRREHFAPSVARHTFDRPGHYVMILKVIRDRHNSWLRAFPSTKVAFQKVIVYNDTNGNGSMDTAETPPGNFPTANLTYSVDSGSENSITACYPKPHKVRLVGSASTAPAGENIAWYHYDFNGGIPLMSRRLIEIKAKKVDPTVPGIPYNLNAIAGNGSVWLSWNAPSSSGSPITNYNVYYGTTSNPTTLAGSPTSSPFTVPNLTNGTLYYFRVSAVNSAGEGPKSGIVTATPSSSSSGGGGGGGGSGGGSGDSSGYSELGAGWWNEGFVMPQ